MSKKKPPTLSSYKELQKMNRRYLKIQKELKQTRNDNAHLELSQRLDDLKEEMGWKLLDLGEYEQGLVLYKSLSWETCGEA